MYDKAVCFQQPYLCLSHPVIVPAGVTSAEADELQLKDGESFFVIVRGTNKLGYVRTIHSNGITVKLDPLRPGNVRDGDIAGVDLNYQLSLTSLSANWDGFGQPKDGGTDTVVNGMYRV